MSGSAVALGAIAGMLFFRCFCGGLWVLHVAYGKLGKSDHCIIMSYDRSNLDWDSQMVGRTTEEACEMLKGKEYI